MATAVAEATIRQLVNFGFPEDKARAAVQSIGDASDTDAAVNWLLDQGEEDKGGAVEFKHCPHIGAMGYDKLIKPSQLRYGQGCVEGCGGIENWLCLHTGVTRCGRYAKKHSLQNWERTKREQESKITVAGAAAGEAAFGHCLAIGLSDLSIWCYECQAYVQHECLLPLSQKMEELKFGRSTTGEANGSSSSSSPAPVPAVGSAPQCSVAAMHGRLGDPAWAPPQLARACELAARPGYKTKQAHEYLDTPEVLAAKVKLLASLIRESKNCVTYTGAGISTASGISDYATKADNSIAKDDVKKVSHYKAQPTYSHRALVALYNAGLLKHWVQQNHDGLPQKAGFPQQALNEVHGAWYDPSNPVVPMDGTLRSDLIQWMLDWEDKVDLCLALGTSMVGMNADRMAVTPSQKAKSKKALGTVIVALQQTQYDEVSSLRIFAPIDEVMALLVQELALEVSPAPAPAGSLKQTHVFEDLPYGADGKLDRSKRTKLDLSQGKRVRLVNQQDWDAKKVGTEGVVMETQDSLQEEGHYAIRVGGGQVRVLGRWWLEAAASGSVPALPIVQAE
eukprot:TRINITY_DN2812_c0_g1_i1.p1 TRINITY_DN2812_c0_g1~~TRINITY_DN2812_c0_g1_i1.p1  ORF type:complete len:596 (+),score=118.83 TRINITY_DN2812_c0_g1_i1:99-1790(+)